jgi:hypothetical protein
MGSRRNIPQVPVWVQAPAGLMVFAVRVWSGISQVRRSPVTATAPTSTVSVEEWVRSFTDASDNDPEIQAHGKYFTCAYLLDMADHHFIVRMTSGKVAEIAVDPGPLDVRYQFAIRASAETWRGFAADIPAPMYHGIWAATFRRDMNLEGDLLVLMQNLRCITRQIELLRTVRVPV